MTKPDTLAQPANNAVRGSFSPRDAMLGWMQEIAPYGIFTTDAELRVQSWNHWLISHSGLPAEKVIGRPLVEVFPDVAARRLDEHFRRALAGEVSVLSTALHKYLLPLPAAGRDSGVPHMLQTVRIAPLPWGEQNLGTITIIEDVTQRECQATQLQSQQEQDRLLSSALAILLQSSDPLRDVAALFPKITLPLGIEAYFNYLHDPHTGMLQLNAAGGILPKQKESLATLKLGEGLCGQCALQRNWIIRSQLQDSSDAPAETMRGLGFRAYCCFPLLVEDRLLGTLAFASSTRDAIAPDEMECLSTVAQYVAIAMDRAFREKALREAQLSLREHAENLETKVAERTARLHETIAQLESFSYTIAHDLRAPIRSLRGYCDILLSDYALPESGAAILKRLQRASDRLDALTRDLLRFSKIVRQDVQLEPVDLNEIVQDLVLLTPALQDDVVIVHPPLEKVWAQRTLLQQCLSNLFENAVKFVASGTRPRIIVRSERRQGDPLASGVAPGTAFNPAIRAHDVRTASPAKSQSSAAAAARGPGARVRVWIEDNGIGVAPEAHEKIFGIFERVSGLDHVEGTGIGLAIVARAMQQMGGRCGVESTVGKGSRFWLEFAPADAPLPAARTKHD